MKTKRYVLALLAAEVALLTGCTILPDHKSLDATTTPGATRATCASSKESALNCAYFLRDQFAEGESHISNGEKVLAFTSLAVGTLTAIYLKSDTDRTQAIEDLAVGVGALTGIRSILRPADSIKVMTQGRRAVECMIQATEGITAIGSEIDDSSKEAVEKKAADVAGAAASLALAAKAESEVRDAINTKWIVLAPENKQPLVQKLQAVRPPNETIQSLLRAHRESLPPLTRFQLGVESEFGLTHRRIDLLSGNAANVPAAEVQRTIQGTLLLRQARAVADAKVATQTEIKAASEDRILAQRLAFGLHQVLANAKLALGGSIEASESIALTQRDAVRNMIGKLVQAVEEEQKQGERLVGAATATAGEEGTDAAASDLNAETKSPSRSQLQQIFTACTAE